MTARRPKQPRAGRPAPTVEDGPAAGPHEGHDAARPARAVSRSAVPQRVTASKDAVPQRLTASKSTATVRTGRAQRKPSVPRGVGPSATRDPHSGALGARIGRTPGPGGPVISATKAAPEPSTAPSTVSRTGSKPVSPSQARAAERSELAGSIRRGRLGSRRASSAIQPAEEATPIPAKTFSGRLLALAVVLVAVIILLAPTVSRYVQQQAELEALRADIASQQQQQEEYQAELARWDDPAYVKQQARERIFLVMPGETRYLVKGGEGLEEGTGEGSPAGPADVPWVDALWSSVERAATD